MSAATRPQLPIVSRRMRAPSRVYIYTLRTPLHTDKPRSFLDNVQHGGQKLITRPKKMYTKVLTEMTLYRSSEQQRFGTELLRQYILFRSVRRLVAVALVIPVLPLPEEHVLSESIGHEGDVSVRR